MSNTTLQRLGRRLRLGLIGGGHGFIGPVHRTAARLDDRFELCAGVLSSDAERGLAAATAIGLPAERSYATVEAMIAAEKARPDGIDAVAIMTPNVQHHAAVMAALRAGLHVICDKPVTTTVADAVEIMNTVEATGLVFCLTHCYAAYPMVKQARAMVEAGVIGEVRQIHATYVQGYFATLVEADEKNRTWRFDTRPGTTESLVIGDIGTHAHHLGAYISGLELTQVMADVGPTVPGRTVDDYGALLTRWSNGARGTIWVTNSAAGSEHGLAVRIFGSQGGLEWHQEYPNELKHRRLDGFEQTLTRRLHGALAPAAEWASRIEIGHPEGYQEAFANLYRDFAEAVTAKISGQPCNPLALDFPGALDGVRGLRLIEAAVQSTKSGQWTNARHEV